MKCPILLEIAKLPLVLLRVVSFDEKIASLELINRLLIFSLYILLLFSDLISSKNRIFFNEKLSKCIYLFLNDLTIFIPKLTSSTLIISFFSLFIIRKSFKVIVGDKNLDSDSMLSN